MNRLICYAVTFFLATYTLSACSAGPTKRYVDGSWDVSENICSSNPAKPDLGDMRSELRSKLQSQTSFERNIKIFHLDRTILDVSQIFRRSGPTQGTGNIELYENSSANPIIKTVKLTSSRELNNAIKSGVEDFFANDPDIDGKEAVSFCLYRGQ